MFTRRHLLAAAGAVCAVPLAAEAHREKVLDHSGPVSRSTYANPHGTLYMVKDGQELTIELAPTSRMQARGLSAEDVAPGKTVRVYAYQNRGNPNVYRAEWVEVAGRRVELR
ncbi:MAG: hypothetical protein FD152_1615 [Xanthobacteraceae bacterium]|nr:MAG: hypothetical protein FD152_1615 [Xanthobacteraceae bacterium]